MKDEVEAGEAVPVLVEGRFGELGGPVQRKAEDEGQRLRTSGGRRQRC